MLLENISAEVATKIVSVLEEEKSKLLKSIEDINFAISQFKNGKKIHSVKPAANDTDHKQPIASNGRGSMNWKYKIDKVLHDDRDKAMPSAELVAKICSSEPNLNKATAIKSIGSALSQNSNNSTVNKNRYLFIKKNGIKAYFINKDFNKN